MKYRKMTSDGDYVFGFNQQGFYENTEAVAQCIRTRLLLLQKEWWEDISLGTPFFTHIVGIKPTEESVSAADLIIRDRIMSTPHVLSILEYSSKIDNLKRTLKFEALIKTEYGEARIQNEI